MMSEMQIKLDSKKITNNLFIILIVIESLLFLGDVFINYNRLSSHRSIRQMFNMTREDSLANWVASLQAIFVGVTVWIIYYLSRIQNAATSKKFGYIMIALFFSYVGLDDGCKLHERLGTVTQDYFNDHSSALYGLTDFIQGFPSYTWHILFTPVFASFGFWMLIFLYREASTQDNKILLFEGISCFGLAVVMDFIEGSSSILEAAAQTISADVIPFKHFLAVLEEFIELIGTSLFLALFISILLSKFTNLRLLSPKSST